MSKRVWICLDGTFPHGDAGSNRIYHLAKALTEAEYRVSVVSFGKGPEEADGINATYVPLKNGSAGKLMRKLFGGKKAVRYLDALHPQEGDTVLIYGSNSRFVGPLLKYCAAHKLVTCLDVVEWHQPFQYRGGAASVRYRSSKRTFEKLGVKAKNIIAISTLIRDYYTERGCNVGVFPPMCDTGEVGYAPNDTVRETVELIYPGNPFGKDDIGVMLKGLALLEKEKLAKIRFHLTGVGRDRLCSFLGKDAGVVDQLGDSLVFHGKLPYGDLLELYRNVGYLYLSRPDNLVTRANFPSKVPELTCRGIVPVCNRVGDYYAYLEDGKNAVLFDSDTPEECAEAVGSLLNKTAPEVREMKRAARECAEQRFDYRVWIKELDAFFGALKS